MIKKKKSVCETFKEKIDDSVIIVYENYFLPG